MPARKFRNLEDLLTCKRLPRDSERSKEWLKLAFKLSGKNVTHLSRKAKISWQAAKNISLGGPTHWDTRLDAFRVLRKDLDARQADEARSRSQPGRRRSPGDSGGNLRRNRGSILEFFPLKNLSGSRLAAHIDNAPRYSLGDYRILVENAIGAIHALPDVLNRSKACRHSGIRLKHLEIYFGRSSGGRQSVAQNLSGRFRTHREQKRHEYGMVFGTTETVKRSLYFEKFGTILLDSLKQEDGLCISNKTNMASGGKGNAPPGILYMTFRLHRLAEEPGIELNDEQIAALVRECISSFGRKGDRKFDSHAQIDRVKEGLTVGMCHANNLGFLKEVKLAKHRRRGP